MKPRRPRVYRQAARAAAFAANNRSILAAFVACTNEQWFDEVTLDQVARRAGVSVRTVIRSYGGKEGLIEAWVEQLAPEISERRKVVAGDVSAAVSALFGVYEEIGDSVIRSLAQEPRYPALQPLLEHGRKEHRRITEETFSPWLDRLTGAERRKALDALIVATDVYGWKLLRRDMARSVAESRVAMTRLINAVLVEYTAISIKDVSS